MEELKEYLIEVMKNSHYCQHCSLYHPEIQSCFFGYECIKKNFCYYKEENSQEERWK